MGQARLAIGKTSSLSFQEKEPFFQRVCFEPSLYILTNPKRHTFNYFFERTYVAPLLGQRSSSRMLGCRQGLITHRTTPVQLFKDCTRI